MTEENKTADDNQVKKNKPICIVKGEKPNKGEPIVDFYSISDIPAYREKIMTDLAKKVPSINIEEWRKHSAEYKKSNSAESEPNLYNELLKNIQSCIKKIECLISDAGITLPESEVLRMALLLNPKDGSALGDKPLYYLRVLLQFTQIKEEVERNSNNPDALMLAKKMLSAGEDYSIITSVLPHANAAKIGYSLGRKNEVTEELVSEFEKQYRERIKNGDSKKAAKTYAAKYGQGKWRETNLDPENNPNGKAPTNDTFIKAWHSAGYKD